MWLKQSTAVTIKLGPFVDSTDGVTAETGLAISQADIRLSKNGAAFGQTNNAAGATHDENGYYGVPLNTTDTNTLGTLRVAVNESGALPVWQDFMVVPANIWDSLFGSDKFDVNVEEWNATEVPSEHTAGYPIVTVKDGTGTGEIDTASGRVTITEAQIDQIVDEVFDEDATAHQTQGSFGQVLGDSGSDSDSIWSLANASLGGTLATATAVANIQADTDDIQSRLPAALTASGNMKADTLAISGDATAADNLETMLDGTGGQTLSLGQLNVVNATGSAIIASSTGGNGHGLAVSGNGTGAGISAVGGVTGHGAACIGGSSSGSGLRAAAATDGHGIQAAASGSGKDFDATTTDALEVSVTAMASGVITAATIAANAIGASELAADAVAEIADQVWDEALAGHLTAGSAGAALNTAGSAGDPWATALPGAYGTGTAGKIVGDNLDATVSSRSTAAALATVQADTDDIQSRLPAALTAGGNMKSDALAISGDTTAADNAESFFDGTGYAGTGNVIPTVTSVTNRVTANTDQIEGVDATNQIRDSILTDATRFAGASVDATISSRASAAALATIQSDTDDIQTRLPAALVSGRIDASVGAMAAGVVTAAAVATDAIDADAIAASAVTEIQTGLSTLDAAGVRAAVGLVAANLDTQLSTIDDLLDTEVAAIKAKTDNLPANPAAVGSAMTLAAGAITTSTFGAGAIDAAAIAANAIDSDALAASAISEIQSGLSTITAGQVNAEVLDVLNVDAFDEPGQETPSATTSLATKIGYLYKFMRNKITQSSTELNVYADDGVIIDQKATISDDGATFTRGKIGTGQ